MDYHIQLLLVEVLELEHNLEVDQIILLGGAPSHQGRVIVGGSGIFLLYFTLTGDAACEVTKLLREAPTQVGHLSFRTTHISI